VTKREESPRIVDATVDLSASSGMTVTPLLTSSIVGSQVQGDQTFSLEQSEHQLKAESEAHRRRLEQARADHDLAEAKLDNDARRVREAGENKARLRHEEIIFWLIVVAVCGGLIGGFLGIFVATDADTRRWSQSLVTLIVGGLVGYFTGKRTSQ
jgi:hypothetical protein